MKRGLETPMNFNYCEYCILIDDYNCDNCNDSKQETVVQIKTLEERRKERFRGSKVNESLKAKKQNPSPVSKKKCGKKTFQAKFKQEVNQGRLDGMGSILSQLGI